MKTIAELSNWIIAIGEQFGDPAARTCQIYVRCLDGAPRPTAEIAAYWHQVNKELVIDLGENTLLPVKIDPEGMKFTDEGQLTAFGIAPVCPGVWSLTPSLNVPGLIHAFVTFYDVSQPAPWENRIVVVSSMNGMRLK